MYLVKTATLQPPKLQFGGFTFYCILDKTKTLTNDSCVFVAREIADLMAFQVQMVIQDFV